MNGNRQILYYLTFACEAFDKVPHHHSKLKLECYEVRNQLNSEVDIFLEEHMLPMHSVGGYTSDPANILWYTIPLGNLITAGSHCLHLSLK